MHTDMNSLPFLHQNTFFRPVFHCVSVKSAKSQHTKEFRESKITQ